MEIVTLVLAVWGAILSTILGIREISREKRKIKVFLDHIDIVERDQLTVVNIGTRPITITKISCVIETKQDGTTYTEQTPGDFFHDDYYKSDLKIPLPKKLEDGEFVTILLADNIRFMSGLNVVVYDSEGNSYKGFTARNYDTKRGLYY